VAVVLSYYEDNADTVTNALCNLFHYKTMCNYSNCTIYVNGDVATTYWFITNTMHGHNTNGTGVDLPNNHYNFVLCCVMFHVIYLHFTVKVVM